MPSWCRGWRHTTSRCFYCGEMLMATYPAKRQRCRNDCASGLGECPPHRLEPARGRVDDVEFDLVVGVVFVAPQR